MGVKEDLVTLLNANLSAVALKKDDGVTAAAYEEFVANPPHILAKDWLLGNSPNITAKDGLFTVEDLRAENKRIHGTIPLIEDGRYLIKTWTIAKTGIDGIKLKQKMDNEVKRIFRENPTLRYIVSWESNDRLINGTWIFNTIFTVAVMVCIVA